MKKINVLGSVLLLIGVLLSSCSTANQNTIKMGSKDFTENIIISEIYALALEQEGYTVERVQNIASSITHTSIVNGEIDMYPEYTGTGLLTILKMDLITDPEVVYETVKKEYNQQFNLTWLEYADVNDSAGLVIRKDVAQKYNIKTISDLQKNAENIRFASQGEFDLRDDGLPLLKKVYGDFKWKSSKVYDNGLKYEVLRNNEADLAPAYTTEGQLVESEMFQLVEDDKKVWPPYNIAPVVRNEILEKNPEIADILNNISKKLDNKTVIELNAKVDIEKLEYQNVAKDFFDSIRKG